MRTQALAVFTGRVLWAKTGAFSLVRTRAAILPVHWVGNVLPPDVYVGRIVCGAGRITTYDGGRQWRVTGAVPIPEGRRAIAPIFECLDDVCADPREWCAEFLDRFRPRKY